MNKNFTTNMRHYRSLLCLFLSVLFMLPVHVIPALAVQNNAIEVVAGSDFATGDSTVTVDVSYVQY